jgi:hypothetical protein
LSISCKEQAKNEICPRLQSRADFHSQARHAQTQHIAHRARTGFTTRTGFHATDTVSNAGTLVKKKRLICGILD